MADPGPRISTRTTPVIDNASHQPRSLVSRFGMPLLSFYDACWILVRRTGHHWEGEAGMADDKQQNAWEPLGIRWGVAAGISYPMSRHRSLTDLSSLLAADDAIDSLPDDIASLDFEPLNPQPVAASPPPLPPPLP